MPDSRYKSLYEIARGGMGRVELVMDQRMHFERLHARKRLHDNFIDDTDVRAMFLDEARIAGFIRHPHVVSVTDVGEDEDGPFIVMDFVDGISLSALLRGLDEAKVSLPLSVALSLLAQTAEGLHAAHEATDSSGRFLGVVHRDVSPQNILVGFDGHARVADFGIAKAVGRNSTRTQTGVLKGKLGYSSPEVLRFEEADVRSDLFSFGVCLYEAVAMRRLYSSSRGGPRAILNEPVPDLGDVVDDVPDELVELTFSLLAKSPAHRPSSAGEVASRLRGILRDLPFDDVMSVTDFLEAHFDEERTGQRRRIESARSRVRRETSEASETLPSKVTDPPKWRALLFAVPAGLLVAAVAAYLWMDQGLPGSAVQSATPSEASRHDEPLHEPPLSTGAPGGAEPMEILEASGANGETNAGEANADGVASAAMNAAEMIAADVDAAAERTTPSMPSRRRASMSTMQARGSNVPIWDEY